MPRTEEEASIRPGFARSVQTSRLGKIYHRLHPPLIGWPADTGPMGGEKSARARHLNRMVVSAWPSPDFLGALQNFAKISARRDPRGIRETEPGLTRPAHPAGRGPGHKCCMLQTGLTAHPRINQMSRCMVKTATKLLALNSVGIVLPGVCVAVYSAVASALQFL